MSCPDDGVCAGELEVFLSDVKPMPVSVKTFFEPGNTYFRFQMTQIDLVVSGQLFYRMAVSGGHGSAQVGLAFPTKNFTAANRIGGVEGVQWPIFIPAFTNVQIDVQREDK